MNTTPTLFSLPGNMPTAVSDGGSLTVWCAAGMLTVQLGVSIKVAEARLRAHAAAAHRPLDEVARDVPARRLRLS